MSVRTKVRTKVTTTAAAKSSKQNKCNQGTLLQSGQSCVECHVLSAVQSRVRTVTIWLGPVCSTYMTFIEKWPKLICSIIRTSSSIFRDIHVYYVSCKTTVRDRTKVRTPQQRPNLQNKTNVTKEHYWPSFTE